MIYDVFFQGRLTIICIVTACGERERNIHQGKSRFDRFDFDMVRYFGFGIASIFRTQNPRLTRCLHPATCLCKCFGFNQFDKVSVSI